MGTSSTWKLGQSSFRGSHGGCEGGGGGWWLLGEVCLNNITNTLFIYLGWVFFLLFLLSTTSSQKMTSGCLVKLLSKDNVELCCVCLLACWPA